MSTPLAGDPNERATSRRIAEGRETRRLVKRVAVPRSGMRPAAIDRKLGASREGRVEREEEDGLRVSLRTVACAFSFFNCFVCQSGAVVRSRHLELNVP
jgi:hypothetical protein